MANVAVDVLLALGVAAVLVSCVGVVVMRDAYDRLHYAAAATSVGPFLILAAVLVRVHVSAAGMEAIAAVAFLFLASPVLAHATGRAILRREEEGRTEAPERENREAA
jgi:multicomponent Na+:H+ antiporter subunit G